MLAARRAKLPYLLTFHGGGHSSQLRNALRGSQLALLRRLLTHAERLVTLAHFEQGYYTKKLHLPAERLHDSQWSRSQNWPIRRKKSAMRR
jgi:hypothetical protein